MEGILCVFIIVWLLSTSCILISMWLYSCKRFLLFIYNIYLSFKKKKEFFLEPPLLVVWFVRLEILGGIYAWGMNMVKISHDGKMSFDPKMYQRFFFLSYTPTSHNNWAICKKIVSEKLIHFTFQYNINYFFLIITLINTTFTTPNSIYSTLHLW